MLFSEPKIPQLRGTALVPVRACQFQCSSASRKFLNSTSGTLLSQSTTGFSALQRAENSSIGLKMLVAAVRMCFSALQRAENSSIALLDRRGRAILAFQCSSASRKFLNRQELDAEFLDDGFQCSSASRKFLNADRTQSGVRDDLFQCSSASRKFLNSA